MTGSAPPYIPITLSFELPNVEPEALFVQMK